MLNTYRKTVEDALDEYVPPADEPPERLHRAIRYMVFGDGKRVRPILLLLTAEIFQDLDRSLYPPACAIELIHTYSLIHDDLPSMDDDELRRGRSSCHVKFDVPTAILAGDALQALAYELLSTKTSSRELGCALTEELSRAAGSTHLVGGQMMDMEASSDSGTLEDIQNIHRRKTGGLFIACFRMGVRTAGEPSELDRFTSIGKHLGMVFQITDDLLDVEGTEEELGKTTGADQKLDKLTYPAVLGVEEARNRAEEHAETVHELLSPFGEKASKLRDLTDFVLHRTH